MTDRFFSAHVVRLEIIEPLRLPVAYVRVCAHTDIGATMMHVRSMCARARSLAMISPFDPLS